MAISVVSGYFAVAGPASAANLTFRATDDSSVAESTPTAVNGDATAVTVDGSPKTQAMLSFEVGPLADPVTSAHLRLYISDKTSNGPAVWTTDPFEEETVNWTNKPAPRTPITNLGTIESGRWLDIDVSTAVSGSGTWAFLLVPDSSDGMDFPTDEASSNRPELLITTDSTSTTSSTSSTSSTSTTTTTTEPEPTTTTTTGPSGDAFEVGLIGDTGYTSSQEASLLKTRSDMNSDALAFTVHAGDIWEGDPSSCPQSRYEKVRSVFNGFDAPFVYTPGDNEWKDCPESSSSRLSMIRSVFFSTSSSLGLHKMTVTRQSGFPENARWTREGVVFATMDEPGSSGASGSQREANVNWLDETFDKAEAEDAAAVMVIWQDNSFSPSGGALYTRLEQRTAAFGRPVVLVHGDTHRQRIDHPWSDLPEFTRVEVYGNTSSGNWIKAKIDPSTSSVFSFSTQKP